ncbi:FAD-dependent monooxygenase [Sorangium sp. So ce134]
MKIGIIGGGLNGLALGLALRLFGVDFTIYERCSPPGAGGSGIYVWPQGVQILTALLGDTGFLAAGHCIDFLTTLSPAGEVIQSQAVRQQEVAAPACMFLRERLYGALLARVGAERVLTGIECVGVRQDGAAATALFHDGSEATFDVVVGTDGIHSAVRRAIWPGRRAVDSGLGVSRGVVPFAHQRLWDDHCQIFAGDRRRLVTYCTRPETHERYWFAAYTREARAPALDRAALASRFSDLPPFLSEMIAVTPEESILRGVLRELPACGAWVDGRLALLGDSVHAQLPTIGYGFTLGLENGFMLAQALASGRTDVCQALRRYERRAKARSHEIVELTRQFTNIFYFGTSAVTSQALQPLYERLSATLSTSPF